MDTGTLITVVADVATVAGTLMGAVAGLIMEWRRARYRDQREQESRNREKSELLRQERRTALAEVRSAVLTFGVDVQLTLEMRRSPHARLDNGDLPQQIQRTREHYPVAVTALEGLWTLCRDEGVRDSIDAMCETIALAFHDAWSASGQNLTPEKVEKEIRARLRALSGAMAPGEQAIARSH